MIMQTFSSNQFLICPPGDLTSFTPPPCVRLCYNVLFLFAFFFLSDGLEERERIDAGFHLLVDQNIIMEQHLLLT